MDIKNEMPVIGKWVVRYDDEFGMPQFVQGRLKNGKEKGTSITINNIESFDLKDKILKTYEGNEYKLVGAGRRMILIGEDEILEIAMRELDDFEED